LMSTRFQHLAERGILHVDDASLAAQEFVWLVLSIPLNRAMLSAGERFTDEELHRYADEAARVFISAYGAERSARSTDGLGTRRRPTKGRGSRRRET
jgi:TetR/AcrR family transcriptional regulator, mexJK operon transcriptional repressor